MNIKMKLRFLAMAFLGSLVCHHSLAQVNVPMQPTAMGTWPVEDIRVPDKVVKVVRIAQPEITPNGITLLEGLPNEFLWPAGSAYEEASKGDWNTIAPFENNFHQWAIQYLPDVPRDATIYTTNQKVRYSSMTVADRPWMIRWTYAYADKTRHKPAKVELLNIQNIPESKIDVLLGTSTLHGITRKLVLKEIEPLNSVLKILPIHQKIKDRDWIVERCTFDRKGKYVEIYFDAPSTKLGNLKLKISVGVNGYLAQLTGWALEAGLDAKDTLDVLQDIGP
jgi:hypothetical protein